MFRSYSGRLFLIQGGFDILLKKIEEEIILLVILENLKLL
jgi:hypothetical protein